MPTLPTLKSRPRTNRRHLTPPLSITPYKHILLSAKPYKSESNFLNGRSWAYFLSLTSPLSSFQELREAIPMLRRA